MLEIEKLVEETVVHKSFGTGIIKEVDGKYLKIDFPEKNKKSTFAYPLCFDGFLMLENEEKQAEMQKDLEQWKRESGAARKEELWRQYEKTRQEIRAKQTAVEEKKLRAARRVMERSSTFNWVKQEKSHKQNKAAQE